MFQNTGEADAGVRDGAFESLGMLWKCLGEKHILPHVTDLDELKLTKVMRNIKKIMSFTMDCFRLKSMQRNRFY